VKKKYAPVKMLGEKKERHAGTHGPKMGQGILYNGGKRGTR